MMMQWNSRKACDPLWTISSQPMSSEANPVVHERKHEPKPEVKKAPLTQFVGYFLWLGTVGFGGPIALAGHMQQDLVDDRDWIGKEDYLEGLALAQLAPVL
jgi:chromate transporter